MKDLYLVRRDVLDRIHQNPNAVPVVYPDTLGEILLQADVPAILAGAQERLGLPVLDAESQARLGALDKPALIAQIKSRRDLIGFLDHLGYDDAAAGARAAWEVLWDGMRAWDNRSWDWQTVAAGTALASLFCPTVQERETTVLARGSTSH